MLDPAVPPQAEAFALTSRDILDRLKSGADTAKLEAYFGTSELREIQKLARSPELRTRKKGKKVVVLPGILGSLLGTRRSWLDDILWFVGFNLRGRFRELALPAQSAVEALDIVPFYYLKLTLWLRVICGYDVETFHYDWRQGLPELGRQLEAFLAGLDSDKVYIVAHSMGGLVTRAALAQDGSGAGKVERVITLGTPHGGSFVPVQALQAQYQYLNEVMAWDPTQTRVQHTADVVATFPGLYQMLPQADKYDGVDLYDPNVWPSSPRIRPEILRAVPAAQKQLVQTDDRLRLIVGVGKPTVTDLKLQGGSFVPYESNDGDGTVPLRLARLGTAPAWQAEEFHGELPKNTQVFRAVAELIEKGETQELPPLPRTTRRQAGRSAVSREVPVRQVREPFGGKRGGDLGVREAQLTLAGLFGGRGAGDQAIRGGSETVPPGGESGRGKEGSGGFAGLVVSRRRRRLQVVVASGDMTRVPAAAHAVAMLQGVAPSGPAVQYDALLSGAITEMYKRNLFSGSLGKIYLLPASRSILPTDLLMFAGLGSPSEFKPELLKDVAAQMLEMACRLHVHELATVIFGGTFSEIGANLRWMLTGIIERLEGADPHHRFHRLILCQRNSEKLEQLKDELKKLATQDLFDSVEVEFDHIEVPPPADESSGRNSVRLLESAETPAQLVLNLSSSSAEIGSDLQLECTLLPSAAAGTTLTRVSQMIDRESLDSLLRRIERGAPPSIEAFGDELAELVVPPEFVESVGREIDAGSGLVILHNDTASRIPWESVRWNGKFPALEAGLARIYINDQRAASMRPDSRQTEPKINVLLVVDPTDDLPGARAEGDHLRNVLGRAADRFECVVLEGGQATRVKLLDTLREQTFDILHYAGHAGFDPMNRLASGLLCADNQILSGADLRTLGSKLPPVVILNACESGRVRKRPTGMPVTGSGLPASVAEAMLNAGLMVFIGTYWPVDDTAAKLFGEQFYECLLDGMRNRIRSSVGAAMKQARQAMHAQGLADWANYMLYGKWNFVLRDLGGS